MNLLISFYGDDFTGSTDVMESLSLNGIPTALFLEVPDSDEVRRFRLKNNALSGDGKLMAIGVAGISRSMTPEQMEMELPGIFERLTRLGATFFHYKVCSTFDSSPHIGNIGYAVEIALRYFPSEYIPLIIGIPLLNRFCVFANLFARVDDVTYRIDRHPTMSKHPVTPMHEADIRLHMRAQTERLVHLVDVIMLENEDGCRNKISTYAADGCFILFDVLEMNHLETIGNLIAESSPKPKLIVGSSGVEYALSSFWQKSGSVKNKAKINATAEKATRYIVVAGSCSPGTARQIEYGLSIGYNGIRVNTMVLLKDRENEIGRCITECLTVLNAGRIPLLYSAIGPDDPSIEQTRQQYHRQKHNATSPGESLASLLAGAQGKILKGVIDRVGKLRVTVAGGDTSGFVSKALKIYALEVLIPIAPGAPLCLAHARDDNYDGLEISLKGGQNGNERYFESVRTGKAL